MLHMGFDEVLFLFLDTHTHVHIIFDDPKHCIHWNDINISTINISTHQHQLTGLLSCRTGQIQPDY